MTTESKYLTVIY